MSVLHLTLLPGLYAICRLGPGEPVPAWAHSPGFSAVTRTPSELSIVCLQSHIPLAVEAERGWRALCVAGQLAFDQLGVLAGLSGALAAAAVPLFAISTYDTDYIFVKEQTLTTAALALAEAGYSVDLSAYH